MTWRGVARRVSLVIGISFTLILITSALGGTKIIAAQITNRSLTLEGQGANTNGSEPGSVVNHYFQFTIPSTTNVQSIQFEYCLTATGTCSAPSGLTDTGATITGLSGGLSGFSSINDGTTNAPYIYSSSGADIAGAQSLTLNGITNPTLTGPQTNLTFYVRISTFTTNNATGTPVDTGNVAASVTNQIVLTGTMPESLVFCDGGTISTTNSIPDCTTATSPDVGFNQEFSPDATSTATSQMAASTNATTGYAITVDGATLTSGSNTIPALTSSQASAIGYGQFGLNLVANDLTSATPNSFGSAIAPSSDGVNYKGEPVTGFNTTGDFEFVPGTATTIANSADGGAGPTDSQIYTVSYIVNVTGNQKAGTYTTTLTYICTPYF